MRKSSIDKIEYELTVSLPEQYRRFLLNYPRALHQTEELQGSGTSVPLSRHVCCSKASDLIRLNRTTRENVQIWTKKGRPGRWPKHMFVIGEDGCGNYYAINLQHKNVAIYFFNLFAPPPRF